MRYLLEYIVLHNECHGCFNGVGWEAFRQLEVLLEFVDPFTDDFDCVVHVNIGIH